ARLVEAARRAVLLDGEVRNAVHAELVRARVVVAGHVGVVDQLLRPAVPVADHQVTVAGDLEPRDRRAIRGEGDAAHAAGTVALLTLGVDTGALARDVALGHPAAGAARAGCAGCAGRAGRAARAARCARCARARCARAPGRPRAAGAAARADGDLSA